MSTNIKENDEKILEQFPHYKRGENFVGTREYWEGVFMFESNRNPELHTAFSELHEKLVNEIIQFCKEHNLKNVTEVHLSADGLEGSFEYGKWAPATDSSMSLIIDKVEEKTGMTLPDREHPFLYEI